MNENLSTSFEECLPNSVSSWEDLSNNRSLGKILLNTTPCATSSPRSLPSKEVVKIRVTKQGNYNPAGQSENQPDYKIFTEDVVKTNNLPQIIHSIKQDGSLPGLVIAVVGDSESFVPRPWNAAAFTSGLIQTVSGAKDSWIIFRGKEDGISSLIYNAFKKDSTIRPETTCCVEMKTTNTGLKTQQGMKNNEKWKTKLIALKPISEIDLTKNQTEDVSIFYLEPVVSQTITMQDIYDDEDFQQEWYSDYLSRFLETLSKLYTTLLVKDREGSSVEGRSSNNIERQKKPTEVLLEMRVPVLLIVVEGDITTIEQVRSAVERKVPVLLVKGSGKAANLIADYLSETGESDREKLLIEKAPLLFGIYIEKDKFDDLKTTMENIASLHYMITVFDVDNPSENKMEDAVVEAIIKGWSLEELDIKDTASNDAPPIALPNPDGQKKGRKRKTITCKVVSEGNQYFDQNDSDGCTLQSNIYYQSSWSNKCHVDGIMKHYQFTLTPGSLSLYFYIAYQFIQEVSMESKKEDLQLLLLEAIIANRVDYVSAMMQNGVQFDPKYIGRLYDETLKCPGCDGKDCRSIHAIHYRSAEENCKLIWCTCTTESIYSNCIRHQIDSIKLVGSDDCMDIKVANAICKEFLNYPEDKEDSRKMTSDVGHHDSPHNARKQRKKINDQDLDNIYHNLLAWALFANRSELAGVFWTKCENQLLTAVMASGILKNMAGNVESAKDRKLHEELMHHSKLFEDRVLAMQNSLYEEKEIECMGLMQTSDNIWGIEVNPMECAYDNNMMDVIGHPCVQRLLNNIWYNKSATKWTQWMKSLIRWNTFKGAFLSPVMSFTIHYIFMLALIVCFSAFILTNIQILHQITDVGVYEWLLYVWLLGDYVEEVLRKSVLAIRRGGHRKFRLLMYITNFWNILTLISYNIILSAISVRIHYRSEEYLRMQIRLYSFGLFTIYMRFLQSMLVLSYFGPKIIMIGKMLVELIKIGWILVVFIMCTGVLYHANMFPSHYDMWSPHGATYWRIWKIVSLPYWQIYGELSLDYIEGKDNHVNCTNNQSQWQDDPENTERCVDYDWSLMIIASIYMLITNLLLVNLVIALFSYRFEEVQNNSDRLWKFWRYSIITDFQTRFPVPFNLLIRPFHTLIACFRVHEKEEHLMEKQQPLHAVQCLYNEKIKK